MKHNQTSYAAGVNGLCCIAKFLTFLFMAGVAAVMWFLVVMNY